MYQLLQGQSTTQDLGPYGEFKGFDHEKFLGYQNKKCSALDDYIASDGEWKMEM